MTITETCSWCTEEVPDSTLRETIDGARICRPCRDENASSPSPVGMAGTKTTWGTANFGRPHPGMHR